jgi:Asp-tRNA(Asn)/Glu-tRNA(Gln) amidotransferase A subunit family amidase
MIRRFKTTVGFLACSIVLFANETVDDPEIYDGAHVSLQIVGRRLQEEKILAIAAHVENILSSEQ